MQTTFNISDAQTMHVGKQHPITMLMQ